MIQSNLQPISTTAYRRLLARASREADFVHLGSCGRGPGAGRWRAFSALAQERYQLCHRQADDYSPASVTATLEHLCENYRLPAANRDGIPMGGLLGYVSYEYGYLKEPRLAPRCPDLPMPVLHAGLFLWMASASQNGKSHYLWVHPRCPHSIRRRLDEWLRQPAPPTAASWQMTAPFRPWQTPEGFRQGVQSVKDYIRAGDCYQANLSQAFSGHWQGDPWAAYCRLSAANPTPYSAFMRVGDWSLLSVSPERFLNIEERIIRTSPIKGTRPRGRSRAEDQALAAELLASEKDRAENLMIVDLLRNDLSVNASTGSVTVDRLFALESWRNVHHLVSHIRARLADAVSPLRALLDAFPGGSITGAPKIRAMEIIRELEPHWRGPYCGSVFYYRLDGSLDSSIAIRTLVCNGEGHIHCWGGGGIVADSEPESEYQETLTKVAPLMRFLEELSCTRAGP